MGNVVRFPFRVRQNTELALEAAVEWLVTEAELDGECGVRIDLLRARAKRELSRPRDAVHREWAQVFLRETAQYEHS